MRMVRSCEFFVLLILGVLTPIISFSVQPVETALRDSAPDYGPKSFTLKGQGFGEVKLIMLEPIDSERLIAEDIERSKNIRNTNLNRFAISERLNFNFTEKTSPVNIDGGRLWRLEVEAPGAVSNNFQITGLDGLPEDAKIWVYESGLKENKTQVTAFSKTSDYPKGVLWTPIIKGPRAVLELFIPNQDIKIIPNVVILRANKAYEAFELGDQRHGTCNNDVKCEEGEVWQDQINSVVAFTIEGTSLCTGQLINSISDNPRPYVLSSHHCKVSKDNDDTLVFYWKFQAPSCGLRASGDMSFTQSGAVFKASNINSDFLLMELESDPLPIFDAFLTGWDITGIPPQKTVAIHHPLGNVKSISFNNDPVISSAYDKYYDDSAGTHWRVDNWESGTTEENSSGSCLWHWDENTDSRLCIGQLHGRYTTCEYPVESAWYGKLSVSWGSHDKPESSLKPWLDPTCTGKLKHKGAKYISRDLQAPDDKC